MKKQLFFLSMAIFFTIKIYAQIGISATNTPPNASAMLDVSSTTKGLLPPRMTSAQRTAIASPADGLLVFDSNTQSYWFRQSGTWTELPKGGSTNNYWQLNGSAGNEIKNTNSGGLWSADAIGLGDNSTDATNPATAPVSGSGTRMMWIPSRSAFRVGSVYLYASNEYTYWDANNIGLFSFASGVNTIASGKFSTAMGNKTKASGYLSTALGSYSIASGYISTAMGDGTTASGTYSTAMGDGTTASGTYSTAIGTHNMDNPNGLFMVGNGSSGNSFSAFIIRKDNSSVGIGIENPLAPLHVAGQSTITGYTSGRLFNFATNNLFTYTGTEYPSIIAEAAIISKTTIGAFQNIAASDSRIKNIISLSNNAEDLARLRKIEITNYSMKDVATWGNQTFKKVIAQQVESVYPEVIKKQTSTIPDIYTLAESVIYDASNKNLSISLSKSYDIKIGEKIELVHPERGKIQAEIVAVSGNTFTVKDWQYATDKIFVFGREVNDFRSVDYEALSMLGISAIQQLAKENEVMKKEINELKSQNFNFQNLKNRIDLLEAKWKSLSDIK